VKKFCVTNRYRARLEAMWKVDKFNVFTGAVEKAIKPYGIKDGYNFNKALLPNALRHRRQESHART
jgi:hypothetical protein